MSHIVPANAFPRSIDFPKLDKIGSVRDCAVAMPLLSDDESGSGDLHDPVQVTF